jgi:2-polyprenyl-6-methoxyphenol hydroxylase-like FAD-dependent oxidoreductase
MRLPVVDETGYGSYDVLVAGGGMVGTAAAIAAAREGAHTLLVEKAGTISSSLGE